jgi:hypothetical protein
MGTPKESTTAAKPTIPTPMSPISFSFYVRFE